MIYFTLDWEVGADDHFNIGLQSVVVCLREQCQLFSIVMTFYALQADKGLAKIVPNLSISMASQITIYMLIKYINIKRS